MGKPVENQYLLRKKTIEIHIWQEKIWYQSVIFQLAKLSGKSPSSFWINVSVFKICLLLKVQRSNDWKLVKKIFREPKKKTRISALCSCMQFNVVGWFHGVIEPVICWFIILYTKKLFLYQETDQSSQNRNLSSDCYSFWTNPKALASYSFDFWQFLSETDNKQEFHCSTGKTWNWV